MSNNERKVIYAVCTENRFPFSSTGEPPILFTSQTAAEACCRWLCHGDLENFEIGAPYPEDIDALIKLVREECEIHYSIHAVVVDADEDRDPLPGMSESDSAVTDKC
jgi:hypothetical protein